MAHMSRQFNFDDFDEQCREAIESQEHVILDAQLCLEGVERVLNPELYTDEAEC